MIKYNSVVPAEYMNNKIYDKEIISAENKLVVLKANLFNPYLNVLYYSCV